MPNYHVTWEIDISGVQTPYDAALEAWDTMRARGSIANSFDVFEEDGDGTAHRVDLYEHAHKSFVPHCVRCGTCKEHAEVMAEIAGMPGELVCCEV